MRYLIFIFLLIVPVVVKSSPISHSHGERNHNHQLPLLGIHHQHNGEEIGAVTTKKYNSTSVTSGDRSSIFNSPKTVIIYNYSEKKITSDPYLKISRNIYDRNHLLKLGIKKDLIIRALNEEVEAESEIGRQLWVKNHFKGSIIWDKKASTHGDAVAMWRIGLNYRRGLGVNKNYIVATEWYKKSARKGNPSAQYNLSQLFSTGGYGIDKNNLKAYKWSLIVSENISSTKHIIISNNNLNKIIKKKLSMKEIIEANKLAKEWKHFHKI